MTVEITVAKHEFKLDLQAGGIKVVDFVPERMVPPVVIMNPRGPYITGSSLKSDYNLNLDLVAVAATATNKLETEKLDELIEKTLKALPPYARLISVGQPYNLQTNNAEYLTANISVEVQITI
jgi:hypothetical protein